MANRNRFFPSISKIFKFIGTAWLMFNAHLSGATVVNSNFPAEGTFKEQADFIDALPGPCDSASGKIVRDIQHADDPFQKQMEYAKNEGRHVTVWHHEFDAEYGVVSRRTQEVGSPRRSWFDLSNLTPSVKDSEEVMIGGESQDGSQQAITFRFQRGSDGLLKPVSKNKIPVAEFAAGVEETSKAGVVVQADNCYSSGLRNKKS